MTLQTGVARLAVDDVFDIRRLVSREDCGFEIWSLHHRVTDMRARLFYDGAEARRVAERLQLENWNCLVAERDSALLADINNACADEGLSHRSLVVDGTGAFIAWCFGGRDVLAAVDAVDAARSNQGGADGLRS